MKNNKIEGLRGLLILWIVFYHYTFRYNGLYEKCVNFPVEFDNGGEVGVMMFFVISGYLAGNTILNERGVIKSFIKRYWRLWKPYSLAVLFILIWCLLVPLPDRNIDSLTAFSNLFLISHPGIEYVDSAHWYVSAIVEIQLLFSLSYIIKNRNLRIRAIIGFLATISVFLYCYASYISPLPQELWWFEVATQGTLMGFCIRFLNDYIICKVLVALLSIFLIHINVLYILYIPLFFLCITESQNRIIKIAESFLSNKFLVYIGGISYCWYLIHQMVGFSLMYALIPNNASNILWLLIPIGFTFILAIIIQEFYKSLHKPLLYEFPFFVISFFLLGGFGAIQRIHGHIVNPEPEFNLVTLVGNGLVLLIVSYLLTCFLFWQKKRLFKGLFYFVLFLVFLIVSFIEANFGARICPAVVTLVAETTSTESNEFFGVYAFTRSSLLVYLSCFIIAIIVLTSEFLYKEFMKSCLYTYILGKNMFFSVITGCLLFASLLSCTTYVSLFKCETSDEVSTWQTYGPHDCVSDMLYTWYDLRLAGDELRNAIQCTREAIPLLAPSANTDSLNIILVIGESHIKWHSSIYGYKLPTNPMMDKEIKSGNMFVFENVTAPFIRTSDNIKNMLCSNCIGENEKWYQTPFFPALFKASGWYVSFFDNQRDWKKNSSTVFALNSFLYNDDMINMSYHELNDTSFRYDAEIVEYYSKLKLKRSNRNLILFHLQGQHVSAGDRYPKPSKFEIFKKEDINRKESWIDEAKKQIIAEYDNATYYNDYVLRRIIDLYRDESTIMIYLSDHGEETYDYRDQYGRKVYDEMNEKYVHYIYEIPFLIWCSDKYLSDNPDMLVSIQKAVKKPFSSDNLAQLMFVLGDIQTKYRKEELNPLSNKYRCPKRVIEAKYCFDDYVK